MHYSLHLSSRHPVGIEGESSLLKRSSDIHQTAITAAVPALTHDASLREAGSVCVECRNKHAIKKAAKAKHKRNCYNAPAEV